MRLNDATQRLVLLARARPGLTGAVALFGLLLLVYSASIDIRATRDASITADEPFYLVTTQSLLQDGDLDLRNQYAARSYESFFDHPDGLWTQSVPLADGRVLSPHNVGLSVLLLPGFAVDGLVGAQVQLVLTAALTWALAFVLALRFTGARPWLVWLATVAVALSATGSSTPPRCTRRCRPVWCWWAHCCSRPAGSGPASAGCCYSSCCFRRCRGWARSTRPWRPWSRCIRALAGRRARPGGTGRRRGRIGARLRRVPPRDLRVADAVQRQSRVRRRLDGGNAGAARRHRRSGVPAVGPADRPALRRRALGAGAVRRDAGHGVAHTRRRPIAARARPGRGAAADRDVRRGHDDGVVVRRPNAGDGVPVAADPVRTGGRAGRTAIEGGARSASTRSP